MLKKKLLLSFLLVLLVACSSSKGNKNRTKYFDENNIEISKSKFNQIRATNLLLDIPGDSINHKKLTLREKIGRISDRPLLQSILEEQTKQKLDSLKPIVIIYYPGKDRCNSTGSVEVISRKFWYDMLEDGINQIAQIKPIYIYKDAEGLSKYEGILNWHKDPGGTIERLFFQYHYPCSSFVVISKNGDYISYFGEFSKDYVWNATHKMNQ
ncbi:hypothetical protein [uncultured Flavobacterium sp.]|uniref:hypothetical protein n=1 Tax=uncultured Flavobacterium sp. TaxID=165435 RepID=UPI0030EEABA2|tara:strand:+ start:38319 stop:38951 length:633 start_codon:yes stop_codon:yes gene_type:complete